MPMGIVRYRGGYYLLQEIPDPPKHPYRVLVPYTTATYASRPTKYRRFDTRAEAAAFAETTGTAVQEWKDGHWIVR